MPSPAMSRAISVAGAYQLTSDDTNAFGDVYVFDRATLTNRLVSRSAAGVAGNATSYWATISNDGNHVVFSSSATNLGPAHANGQSDVFITNLTTNAVVRASLTISGAEPNGASTGHGASSDGRYVVFLTMATNMGGGDSDSLADVYVRDTLAGTTTLVSQSTGGVKGNGNGQVAVISGDGRYVMFESSATNLVAGDTNGATDTFVRDLMLNTTTRVSVTNGGLQSNFGGLGTDMSSDGRYVVFTSVRTLGTTTRLSYVNGGVGEPNGHSSAGTISDDGQHISFSSSATNIVAGDTNGMQDGYSYDRGSMMAARLTLGPLSQEANAGMLNWSMSGDGRYAAYQTLASNLYGIGIFWVGAARLPF